MKLVTTAKHNIEPSRITILHFSIQDDSYYYEFVVNLMQAVIYVIHYRGNSNCSKPCYYSI